MQRFSSSYIWYIAYNNQKWKRISQFNDILKKNIFSNLLLNWETFQLIEMTKNRPFSILSINKAIKTKRLFRKN